MKHLEQAIARTFLQMAEGLETGSFGDGGAATLELGKALIDSAVDPTSELILRLLK